MIATNRAKYHPNARKIVTLRHAIGITQEELARMTGFSCRTIQRIESGKSTNFETLHCIGESLGVQTNDIVLEKPVKQRRIRFEDSMSESAKEELIVSLLESIEMDRVTKICIELDEADEPARISCMAHSNACLSTDNSR